MEWWRKQNFLLWLVAGLLLGIGFYWPVLWWLALGGGVLFLRQGLSNQSSVSIALGGWLAWSVKTGIALSWIFSAYPIDWLPTEVGDVQLLLLGLQWLLSSLSLGLGGLFLAIGLHLLNRFKGVWRDVPIPFLWVAGEVCGSFLISVVLYGPGATLHTVTSFGYSGWLLLALPGAEALSVVAGVYGLSFIFSLLVLMGYRLFVSRQRGSWRPLALLLFVFAVTAIYSSLHAGYVLPTARVVIVDTEFPTAFLKNQEGVATIREGLRAALRAAQVQNPDYIILPEDTRLFDQTIAPNLQRWFLGSELGQQAMIVDTGRVELDDGKIVLQAYLYDAASSSAQTAHKRFLVPQGEYVSYYMTGLLTVAGAREQLTLLTNSITYSVGPQTNQSHFLQTAPGILFCFESVDPLGVWRLRRERPSLPFVAHPVSHGWFHTPQQLWQQLDTMLRVQAVWNHTAIISAANHAEGKVYLPNGSIMYPTTVEAGEYWKIRVVQL